MGYFQDTRTCDEHGFVLTPEGTCVRCVKEGAVVARRRRIAKIGTGVLVVVASVLGITVARARVGTAPIPIATPAAPIVAAAPPAAAKPPVAAPQEAPRAPDDWDRALAQADGERERAAAAQAAAEKARQVAAMNIPTPPPETYDPPPRDDSPGGEPPDPAFARGGQRYNSVRRTRGAGGAVTNPAAWGLPANNGGYFRNRTGGH
jgi:hypothetical protein